MKIDDPRSIAPNQLSRPIAPASARPEGSRGADDPKASSRAASPPAARVELSGRARELASARAAADAAPDVRADKVADARQRIAAGTYTVNGEQIARGILDRRA